MKQSMVFLVLIMWDLNPAHIRSLSTCITLRTRSFNEVIGLLKRLFSPGRSSLFRVLYFISKISSLMRMLLLHCRKVPSVNTKPQATCYGSLIYRDLKDINLRSAFQLHSIVHESCCDSLSSQNKTVFLIVFLPSGSARTRNCLMQKDVYND